MDPSEIIQAFVEEPKYDINNRKPRESTEEALNEIEKCLNMIEEKRARGMSKQQMVRLKTIVTLYEKQKYMYDNKIHTVSDRIVSL